MKQQPIEQWKITHDGFLRDENGDVVAKMLEPQKLYQLLKSIKAQAIQKERQRIIREIKMGLLGIITSVGYSMKLSNGQVMVLNNQINDLFKALETNNTKE